MFEELLETAKELAEALLKSSSSEPSEEDDADSQFSSFSTVRDGCTGLPALVVPTACRKKDALVGAAALSLRLPTSNPAVKVFRDCVLGATPPLLARATPPLLARPKV
jgi:hypothetical protein